MSALKGLKEKQETGKEELSWEETTVPGVVDLP